MNDPLRIPSTVLPGHRVEVWTPGLPEGSAVEVTVEVTAPAASAARGILSFLDGLPAGPRSYPTWDEFESGFQRERDAWER